MKLFKPCLLYGAVPQWGGGRVLKTRDRDERPVGSNPTCVVFKEEYTMNEYNVIEKELISTEILQRKTYKPSTQSFLPASLEIVDGKETYRVALVTYNEEFQEISREELEPEIVYFYNRNEGNLSTYKKLSKSNAEYQEAVEAGFNGSLDDYLSKRDYT